MTRRQLERCALPARTIDNWIESGRLIRKFPGVYRLGHEAAPEFADELAAVMACGQGAILSHLSAAQLWGLLPRSAQPGPIAVLLARRTSRPKPGVQIHRTRSLHSSEATIHRGVPVTTPVRTLLDLAAEVDTRTLERALNEAQVLDLTKSSDLRALLAQRRRHRGARALRALATNDGASGITRSEAERCLLALIRAAGLPIPRTNARVGPYEVDMLWPDQRLVAEVDGFRYHSSRFAFERDRARDAELTACGYRVIRVTWRQITDESFAVVARIAQALGSAA